jgi:hypothetical protein
MIIDVGFIEELSPPVVLTQEMNSIIKDDNISGVIPVHFVFMATPFLIHYHRKENPTRAPSVRFLRETSRSAHPLPFVWFRVKAR